MENIIYCRYFKFIPKAYFIVVFLSFMVTNCGNSERGGSEYSPKSTSFLYKICRTTNQYDSSNFYNKKIIGKVYEIGLYNPCTLKTSNFMNTNKAICDKVNLNNKIKPPVCPYAGGGGGGGGAE